MSNRTKQSRARLDRDRIVEAAVALVDRDGIEGLSMRKLGRELAVEAMALYHYFPSKDALIDAIVEAVVGEMGAPSEAGSWEERLRERFRSYRQLAQAHPHVFPLVGKRTVKSPEALAPVEQMLDILRGAGFTPEQALQSFRTLSSYAYGYALAEIVGFALEPSTDGTAARFDVRTVDPKRFPRMREVAPHVVACDHDTEFELGLDLILAGLAAASESRRT
ncbi:MAG: TetR/AcrR family transcriptional regulator C-terminal domain-containing protein [Gaiellaceae bacterium]